MSHSVDALVYTAPGVAELQSVDLGPLPEGMVAVETAFSGLSRGTERLIFQGLVPEGEWGRMRAPLQVGDFPFPVRYGYACVGKVTQGPEALQGRDVFCLHPHQSAFQVPEAMVLPLPDGVPPARAVLAANMETALNAIWDASPRPGQRVLIVGMGLLGWLIAALLSRRSDLDVHVTDVRADPGVNADDFGVNFIAPPDVPAEAYDISFHTSASSAGLGTALDALRFEGKAVELSWYGATPVQVPLGGAFHANRLRIQSSQVGHVAPGRRAGTTHRDRLAMALRALRDDRLDALITQTVRFRDLPRELPRLLGPDAQGIATRIVYNKGG